MKNNQHSTYVSLHKLFLVLGIVSILFLSLDFIHVLPLGLGFGYASAFFKSIYQEIEIKELKDKLKDTQNEQTKTYYI